MQDFHKISKWLGVWPGRLGSLGTISENWTLAAWGRDDLGPTAWNCHLHPSLRFSGSSNNFIHAFLAVTSLGNLCPPKLLHLSTQHSVPRLFLLRLSMPPTATHQQDNSYGGSAIWRVSEFVIPLIASGVWMHSGSAVELECRTLDQENPVTNPLRIMAPFMATSCVGITPRQNKILVCA